MEAGNHNSVSQAESLNAGAEYEEFPFDRFVLVEIAIAKLRALTNVAKGSLELFETIGTRPAAME
jgi:hypothetical protein